eukprot:g475.t1
MTGQLICWEDKCNTRDLCPACCNDRVAQENQCISCVKHKCSVHVLGLERQRVQATAAAARLRGKMMQEKQIALSEEHEQRKISEKRHKRAEQQARDEITAAERTQKDRNELGVKSEHHLKMRGRKHASSVLRKVRAESSRAQAKRKAQCLKGFMPSSYSMTLVGEQACCVLTNAAKALEVLHGIRSCFGSVNAHKAGSVIGGSPLARGVADLVTNFHGCCNIGSEQLGNQAYTRCTLATARAYAELERRLVPHWRACIKLRQYEAAAGGTQAAGCNVACVDKLTRKCGIAQDAAVKIAHKLLNGANTLYASEHGVTSMSDMARRFVHICDSESTSAVQDDDIRTAPGNSATSGVSKELNAEELARQRLHEMEVGSESATRRLVGKGLPSTGHTSRYNGHDIAPGAHNIGNFAFKWGAGIDEGCADRCNAVTECAAYVLDHVHNRCILKAVTTPLVASVDRLAVVINRPTIQVKPAKNTCNHTAVDLDVDKGKRISKGGALYAASSTACCAACNLNTECETWVWATRYSKPSHNCWLMKQVEGVKEAEERIMGGKIRRIPKSPVITPESSVHKTTPAQKANAPKKYAVKTANCTTACAVKECESVMDSSCNPIAYSSTILSGSPVVQITGKGQSRLLFAKIVAPAKKIPGEIPERHMVATCFERVHEARACTNQDRRWAHVEMVQTQCCDGVPVELQIEDDWGESYRLAAALQSHKSHEVAKLKQYVKKHPKKFKEMLAKEQHQHPERFSKHLANENDVGWNDANKDTSESHSD